MAFMRPDIYLGSAYLVETSIGTEIVPSDVARVPKNAATPVPYLRDYLEGYPLPNVPPSLTFGHFARLSAPGFMDCTEWSGPYDSAADAEAALSEMYGDDSEDAG